LYDAVAHAFTTIPTGGFSPHGDSAGAFGAVTQWTIVVFMILGGTNFVLLYWGLLRRHPRALARNREFRVYLFLLAVAPLAVASLVIVAEVATSGILSGEATVRHAVFNTVSITTTTGYASADFNLWPTLTAFVFMGLMFLGASAGSTSGSVKLVRHIVIARM